MFELPHIHYGAWLLVVGAFVGEGAPVHAIALELDVVVELFCG